MVKKIVPEHVRRAADRAFVRTLAQGFAATLSGGLSTVVLLSWIRGEVDPLTVGVTVGVSLVSPFVAGAAAYFDMLHRGIPEEYSADS